MKINIILLFLFSFKIGIAQNKNSFYLTVGTSLNNNLNLFSSNGLNSPLIVKNRIFPYFDIGYEKEKKGRTIQFFMSSKLAGHYLELNEKLFAESNNFKFTSSYSALAIGFINNWKILKQQSKDFNFGVGFDINVPIFQKFPFTPDTLFTVNLDKFYSVNSGNRITAKEKLSLNILGQIKKGFYTKKNHKIVDVKMIYSMSFNRLYSVNYRYNFQNNIDVTKLVNRGNIFVFCISRPFVFKKK